MQRITRGFTMIELLVVVAVIGILATIGVASFSRIQADTRDSERSSKVTIITEALEKYYEKNGEYPSCADMTKSGSVISKNTLIGVDPAVFKTPTDRTSTNSIVCTDIVNESGPDVFAYVGDGSASCSTGATCLEWTLKYREESTGEIIAIPSRHSASLATSGEIVLAAQVFGFSQVNTSWNDISNASSYIIQRATNAAFTANLVAETTAGTSYSFNGLTAGTTYYFRVQPQAANSVGNWSATKSVTTEQLSGVGLTAVANSNSQITATWNSVPSATSYTLQYAKNSTFSPIIQTFSGLTTTSRAITGLETGVTYYLRAQAVAPGDTSPWSNIASATTNVPSPACNSSTLNTNRQITVSWDPVSVADSYTLQYANNAGFTSPGTLSGLTTTSRAVTGLNNGTTYYFRVMALNGSTASAPTPCPTRATGVDGPSSVGWSSMGYAVRNRDSVTWMPGGAPSATSTWSNGIHIYGTCSPGATVVVKLESYYAYSNNTTQNTRHYMDWTWGNQVRYVIGGSDSWKNWWHGWVACQVGSSRAGDTYLGNAGGY